MGDARWDVFFSYARSDAALARPLIDALQSVGLRVFVDDRDVREFASISAPLSAALAESTLLLAFYSRAYPSRSSCNHELTLAFIAGQREGDPCRRIVVVSPLPSFDHVHPIELRDVRSLSLYDHLGREKDLAATVAARAAEVGGAIGPLPDAARVRWHLDAPGPFTSGIQPFPRALWDAHSALRPGAAAYHTGRWEGGLIRLRSLDEATAAVFAHDYVLRFGAAYPGGVVWLNAEPGERTDPADAYRDRLRELCVRLGVRTDPGDGVRRLRALAAGALDAAGPSLWVVGGFAGTDPRLRALLRNPQTSGSTLLLDGGSQDGGSGVDITAADEGAALALLSGDGAVLTGPLPEGGAAEEIVGLLGAHPAALEAARRLVAVADPIDGPYQRLRDHLLVPSHDVLDFHPAYAHITERLAAEALSASPQERACLLWACDRGAAGLGIGAAAHGLATLSGLAPERARPLADRLFAQAAERPFAHVSGGGLYVHPVFARAVRYRVADAVLAPVRAARHDGPPGRGDRDRTSE